MSKENGYIQLRRGIWEHIRDGSLNHTAAIAYIYMLSEADTRTGVWEGCAKSIASALRIPKRTAQYALKTLEGRYIKRFVVPGKNVCYPILLHRYCVTQGTHAALMLDALNSASERGLEFFKPDNCSEVGTEVCTEVAPQRIKENREKRKTLSASPLFERFWTAYPKKVAKCVALRAWEKIKPEEAEGIIARIEINKLGEWAGKEKQYIPNASSWLNDRRWTDKILAGGSNGNGRVNAAAIKPAAGKYDGLTVVRATG